MANSKVVFLAFTSAHAIGINLQATVTPPPAPLTVLKAKEQELEQAKEANNKIRVDMLEAEIALLKTSADTEAGVDKTQETNAPQPSGVDKTQETNVPQPSGAPNVQPSSESTALGTWMGELISYENEHGEDQDFRGHLGNLQKEFAQERRQIKLKGDARLIPINEDQAAEEKRREEFWKSLEADVDEIDSGIEQLARERQAKAGKKSRKISEKDD